MLITSLLILLVASILYAWYSRNKGIVEWFFYQATMAAIWIIYYKLIFTGR